MKKANHRFDRLSDILVNTIIGLAKNCNAYQVQNTFAAAGKKVSIACICHVFKKHKIDFWANTPGKERSIELFKNCTRKELKSIFGITNPQFTHLSKIVDRCVIENECKTYEKKLEKLALLRADPEMSAAEFSRITSIYESLCIRLEKGKRYEELLNKELMRYNTTTQIPATL